MLRFSRLVGSFRGLALLTLMLLIHTPCLGAQDLRVMSFNIRYGTADDGENAWPLRQDLVAEAMTVFQADIVGVQEALAFQLEELSERLPSFDWVGVGRDDGLAAGEYAAIFYRKGRFRVLETGTFWFSDTPDTPGSMSWGNEIPRICTWARFLDQDAGHEFVFFNVHWDHRSQPSREKAASLLLERIRAMAGGAEGVLVTGDFNAGEENPAFRSLLESPLVELREPFRLLFPHAENVGTFHGFQGSSEGEKIDAILMGPGWDVLNAGIDRFRSGGRYPSDHFPVTATLRWGR